MTKTIVCDIDGTILRQDGDCYGQIIENPDLTPGTLDKIREWEKKNYNIVLKETKNYLK